MFKGIVFDMDGVLVDSETIDRKVWRDLFDDYKIHISDEEIVSFTGKTIKDILQYVMNKTGLPLSQDFLNEKNDRFFQVASKSLCCMPGVKEFLEQLNTKNIPIAIASSSDNKRIQFSLETTGLNKYFQKICSANDVKRGKPAPDIYLSAAEKLNLDSKLCIAIEDSIHGVTSAKAAGMHVIGYLSSYDEQTLQNVGADQVFSHFNELTMRIDKLF